MMTDREMPGMNGLELVREIRADPKIRNVPIVIMSASSEAQHAEAAITAGANFFMTKPFNLTTGRDHAAHAAGAGLSRFRRFLSDH